MLTLMLVSHTLSLSSLSLDQVSSSIKFVHHIRVRLDTAFILNMMFCPELVACNVFTFCAKFAHS